MVKVKLSEGLSRILLTLQEKKDEQRTLFEDIVSKKLTIREADALAKNILNYNSGKNIREKC